MIRKQLLIALGMLAAVAVCVAVARVALDAPGTVAELGVADRLAARALA